MLPIGPYTSMLYDDPEYRRIMRRLHNARTKTVVHHETCPCCGAKLVNLYRQSVDDKMWKCRKCWEKHNNGDEADISESRRARCQTCQVQVKVSASTEPAVCRWYLDNVVCGDKSTKSCPNYKPVEGE